MLSYARRDLLRNPRRTLASLVGRRARRRAVLRGAVLRRRLWRVDDQARDRAAGDRPAAREQGTAGRGVRLASSWSRPGPLRAASAAGRARRPQPWRRGRRRGARQRPAPAAAGLRARQRPPRRPRRFPTPAARARSRTAPGRSGYNLGTVPAGATVHLSYAVQARRRRPDPGAACRSARASPAREHPVPEPAEPAAARRPRHAARPDRARSRASPPPTGCRSSARRPARCARAPEPSTGRSRCSPSQPPTPTPYPPIQHRPRRLRAPTRAAQPGGRAERWRRRRRPGRAPLPGRAKPVSLPVSGVADLSRARALFNSREGLKLEDFLYVPDSVVISPASFDRLVLPAFRRATATRGNTLAVKSPPTTRARRRARPDPAALRPRHGRSPRPRRWRRQVGAIAPRQDFLLDNISNTLTVARADAAVAKRMFLFLGLPGLLLAGFLAAYAGAVLAAAQRREHAMLRLRGARSASSPDPAYRTVGARRRRVAARDRARVRLVARRPRAIGAVRGGRRPARASRRSSRSAPACSPPGSRCSPRVGELCGATSAGERRELAAGPGAALAAPAAGLPGAGASPRRRDRRAASRGLRRATRHGVARAGDVTRSGCSSRSAAWLAGTLLAIRLFENVAVAPTRTRRRRASARSSAASSVARSAGAPGAGAGVAGVGLVMAFGVGLAIFAATYDGAKAADAALHGRLRPTRHPVPGQHPVTPA